MEGSGEGGRVMLASLLAASQLRRKRDTVSRKQVRGWGSDAPA